MIGLALYAMTWHIMLVETPSKDTATMRTDPATAAIDGMSIAITAALFVMLVISWIA